MQLRKNIGDWSLERAWLSAAPHFDRIFAFCESDALFNTRQSWHG